MIFERNTLAPGSNQGEGNNRNKRNASLQTTVSNDRLQGELPQFIRDMLAAAPVHGGGVHQWLFNVSRQLHHHRTAAEIFDLLRATVDGCGRNVPDSEITSAIDSAAKCPWQPSRVPGAVRMAKPPQKWPARDSDKIAAIAAADPDALDELRAASPAKICDSIHDSDSILERLFPGDPYLCIGDGVANSLTMRRSAILDAGECSHLVPSPMTARHGTNKQGKRSTRCLDNTGPRTYLVVECDQGDRATQAAVIRHLSAFAPLVMVVDSAGKSLHAWWRCAGQAEERVRAFFRYAVSLGADPATWTKCQLVRMPLGWRHEKSKRQHVLFFDYAATMKEGRAAQ